MSTVSPGVEEQPLEEGRCIKISVSWIAQNSCYGLKPKESSPVQLCQRPSHCCKRYSKVHITVCFHLVGEGKIPFQQSVSHEAHILCIIFSPDPLQFVLVLKNKVSSAELSSGKTKQQNRTAPCKIIYQYTCCSLDFHRYVIKISTHNRPIIFY